MTSSTCPASFCPLQQRPSCHGVCCLASSRAASLSLHSGFLRVQQQHHFGHEMLSGGMLVFQRLVRVCGSPLQEGAYCWPFYRVDRTVQHLSFFPLVLRCCSFTAKFFQNSASPEPSGPGPVSWTGSSLVLELRGFGLDQEVDPLCQRSRSPVFHRPH